jgi:two-component system, OmpR family, sensor histidine kinase KdpD
MSDNRPNPDSLLRRVQAEQNRDAKAVLKVFLGYAPGVGKTYTMLKSAQRLKEQGVDVVVGCVETHGRPETAELLNGLEVAPLRTVAYRSTTLTEFDLDRALARKPKVLILDELAHTNAPGSRHTKRWQDVIELLDSGIEVHTTLNIQHIESLNDVVSQITYVRIRETVPDSILERAREIEVVDLPPDELIERLREGKVYVPEQARQAIDHFFRRGNLLALRELTLRRAAERLDVDLRAYRREYDIKTTWPAAERIMVCVGSSPSSAKILRGARRMAIGLRAPWVAAYVDAPDAYPVNSEGRERLQGHLRLAESLGGEVVRLSGHRVADELLRYAREHNVTRIVIGKPTHTRWRDVVFGSLVTQIVKGSGDIDVHFIAGDDVREPRVERPERPSIEFNWTEYAIAALFVACTTTVGVLARRFLSQPDLVAVFLLTIMLVAFRYGRGPSLLAAALSVAAYDFFFVSPYYTFSVEHAHHVLTFAMMFLVGIVISSLTARLSRQEREARAREARTAALFALNRDLAAAQDSGRAAEVTAIHAARIFGGDAVVLLPNAAGSLVMSGASRAGLELKEDELAVAAWVVEHGRPAGRGTDTLSGSRITCVPIHTGSATLGALAVTPPSLEIIEVENREYLDTFVRQSAISIERSTLATEAKNSAVRIRAEQTRSSLLSAVSHDLRTPLGTITGAGTALRDDRGKLGPEQRKDLCDTICTEAERMERLIGNILDMVRLESGGIDPKREWVPLEEIIGSALTRLETKLGDREVRVALPETLPLLSVDPVLFEQVFVNLFDNIIKYGGPLCPIDVKAKHDDVEVEIEIADRGPGLPEGAQTLVFEKFYRGPGVRAGGVGLGLSICLAILQAHGGRITAENREGGGALFRMTLPAPKAPPAIELLAEPFTSQPEHKP